MNLFSAKRMLIIAALSLVLGLVIIRWNTTNNVSFCHDAAGCRNEEPRGAITERIYGFPLTYKKVTTFRPNNSDESKPDYAGYASTAIENQSFSVPSVLVNALFWFGLLHLLSQLIKPRVSRAVIAERQGKVSETS